MSCGCVSLVAVRRSSVMGQAPIRILVRRTATLHVRTAPVGNSVQNRVVVYMECSARLGRKEEGNEKWKERHQRRAAKRESHANLRLSGMCLSMYINHSLSSLDEPLPLSAAESARPACCLPLTRFDCCRPVRVVDLPRTYRYEGCTEYSRSKIPVHTAVPVYDCLLYKLTEQYCIDDRFKHRTTDRDATSPPIIALAINTSYYTCKWN
ncbi:hypothetical protein F5Y03DRAFT_379679 [Xylaria venustula]|nr:hypothetical protein F5Y03DRAFT_379679 [Xylaria venustula]